jgi:hypothetical protein
LLNKEKTKLVPKSVYNLSGDYFKRGEIDVKKSLSGRALRTKEIVYCEDLESEKDYYDKGKEILEKKLETQNLQYVYFSEDTEWVKETFKNSMKESDNILSRLSDIEEFQLMINCNHFILANSSFSWWASWFSDIHNEAVIIAPSKWFGKDCHKNWSAIYKDKFIQI